MGRSILALLFAFGLGLGIRALATSDEACGDVRERYDTLIRDAATAGTDEGRALVAEAREIASDRADCFTPEELRSLPRPPP